MKPPNIKAPKCTLFSIRALLSRVKGRKGSTVLPRLIASIVGGSLLRRAHFESLRAAEAKNAATINHLMSKRQSVTLFSRVKGHKGSPVLPRLLPNIVMGSLLRRAHFESLRAAEAKNSTTINRIALGAWSRENKALGCASCFIGSRPHPRAIFAVKPRGPPLPKRAYEISNLPKDFKISAKISDFSRFSKRFQDFSEDFRFQRRFQDFTEDFRFREDFCRDFKISRDFW